MNLLVILILLILVFGTGGSYYSGYHNLGHGLGIILLIVVILLLLGRV